ncbi:MAG: DNA-processing protein DprA [Candidatus Cyclobacteriaceae bacterium M3_2C_046]
MNQDKLYQVALSLIPGIGNVLAKHLISYCGSAEAVFKSNAAKIKKIPGIGFKTAELLKNKSVLNQAAIEIERAEKHEVQILHYADKNYPHRLKQFLNAPSILYYKGSTDLNAQKVVAIVGTRTATEYGKEIVEKIVAGMVKHQALIISGLAYGIDITSHKMSLKYGLPTVGVMASGLNIIYPYVHRPVAAQMLERGGLVSEHPIGIKPEAHHFPERNRIIAGMADAVIIVEAAQRGGALITAEIANDYHKDVFAVPGNLGQLYSVGCNQLIKDHKAHIFTSVEDLEYIMSWDFQDFSNHKPSVTIDQDLDESEIKVVELLQQAGSLLIDELSWKSQIPVNRMASLLLNLEFKGIVKSLPGKRFKII